MCRNITELRGLEPPATAEEIAAAARQYVRKVSGFTHPSSANTEAFERRWPKSRRRRRGCWTLCRRAASPRRPPRRCVGWLRPSDAHTATTPALKEWSAVVHALLDGRQQVLLRKGGIGEKRFDVTVAREFMLFPTVAHSHAERVRPEFRDLLDGRGLRQRRRSAVVVRAAAKVVAALPVNRPDNIEAIEDLHIWTAESVRRDRLDFRPKHRLAVLVVQAIPLVEPVRTAAHTRLRGLHQLGAVAGHRPSLGEPVHDEVSLREVAARVRDAVE